LPHYGGPATLNPHDLVIVRYRNGEVYGPVECGKRRWKAWPSEIGESDWDIVAWREAKRGG
jgi:hypothetical protein